MNLNKYISYFLHKKYLISRLYAFNKELFSFISTTC
nr:MAG TPA: hypothetical protein [Caudoviricetes sp.]